MFRKNTMFTMLAMLAVVSLLFSACQPIRPLQETATPNTAKAVADPELQKMLKQVEQSLPATTYVTNAYLPDPAADWKPLTCTTVDKVRVGLSWVLDDEQALWYNALEKGFYKDVCLDVELVPGGPNIDQLQSLLQGKVDVAVTAEGTWLIQTLAQNPNADLVAVGAFLKYSPVAMIGIDRAIPNTQHSTKQITPQDFVGRTIGLPHEGGQLFVHWLTAKYGLPADQIHTVIEGFDMQPLIKGAVDYHMGWILNEPRLVEQAGYQNWHALLVSDWGWNDYADFMVVRRELLGKQPDLVKRYLAATHQGLKYLLEHPEESADITLKDGKALNMPRQMVLRRFALQKPLIVGNDGLPPMHIMPERLNAHAAVLLQQGVLKLAPSTARTSEVQPTGDPVKDIANVQAAINSAKDGDTVLLKAGVFNFGDWKTNPIPGGFVMITKGVTVKGDGVDTAGNPKTIIQGGGYRLKNHWKKGEVAVIAFGADGKGGTLDGVWLKESHMYAVGINGLFGQNHTNITIRNVKVTDISYDIPEWDQNAAIGRPIDLGGNVPEWGNGGPLGTVLIEHCNISNMNATVDLNYIDPETGKPYYRNSDGGPLAAVDSQGIGLWMSTATTFIVRDNTITMQNEGIVTEGMGGTGSIVISNNDITIKTVTLTKHVRHGYRLDSWPAAWAPVPFAREVRIENNHIRVVGEPEAYMYTAGMIMGADNGLPGYAGKITVTNNVIDVQNTDAALAITEVQVDPLHRQPPAPLTGAEISNNRISGTARYGVLSLDGAQNCKIADNDMTSFTPSIAHVGLYGVNTHNNAVKGAAGVYVEADGAHDNTVTGYTAK